MSKHLFVLARTYREALDFARVIGVTPLNLRYIDRHEDIAGLRDITIHRIGFWYEHKDSDRINKYLEVRKGITYIDIFDWR